MRSFDAEDACSQMQAHDRQLDDEWRAEHPDGATNKQSVFIGKLAKKDLVRAWHIILENGANITEAHRNNEPQSRRSIEFMTLDLTKAEASKVIDQLLNH